MKLVSFSLEQGNRYFAEIDGARFLVGKRVSFEGGKGLMNVTGTSTQRYERADYRPRFGFWADFIHPTAMAEGALFHTLNTYDRAQFTFSFLQYAAHVPDGDFVVFMRALLALPTAADYFPDLRLTAGRICRLDDDGDSTALESASSTAGLLTRCAGAGEQLVAAVVEGGIAGEEVSQHGRRIPGMRECVTAICGPSRSMGHIATAIRAHKKTPPKRGFARSCPRRASGFQLWRRRAMKLTSPRPASISA